MFYQATVFRVLFAMIAMAWPFAVYSQNALDSRNALWQTTEVSFHHDSMVRLLVGNAMGTGVIIYVDKTRPEKDGYVGYCLTAYHVVKEDRGEGTIRVEYRNGRKGKGGRLLAHDEKNDVALIWVWVPSTVKAAKLAAVPTQLREPLEFVGLGGGVAIECCLRHFSGVSAVSTNSETIYADLALMPGDSGGAVFNDQQEVVGIISGGWFWFRPDSENDTSQGYITWPAKACNLAPILKLVEKHLGTKYVSH